MGCAKHTSTSDLSYRKFRPLERRLKAKSAYFDHVLSKMVGFVTAKTCPNTYPNTNILNKILSEKCKNY